MKEKIDAIPHKKLFIFLVLTILILIVVFLLLKLNPVITAILIFLKSITLPFLIALIISYVLNPLVSMIHRKGISRSLAVALIYLVFFGSLIIITINLFPKLITEFRELSNYLPEIISKFEGWIEVIRHDHSNPLPDSIQKGIDTGLDGIETNISNSFNNLTNFIGNTVNTIVTIVLIPFVAYYLLKDFQILEKTIITFMPKKNRKKIIRVAKDIDEALGNYVRGELIVCLIIGTLAYIGYLIIGLPYAIVLALIVGLTNIIPYLGPYIGALPALIVAMSISWKMALSVVVVNVIVQIFEGNVVSPQVVGRKLHIHPLFIIISLLVGGKIAGILGLILAVPVFAVLKVIVHHIVLYYTSRS